MTNPSARQIERSNHDLRIKVLLDKLRSKLKNFTVLDNAGLLVGKVKDAYLDSARQLNLVISDSDIPGKQPFLLRTTHIQEVDYPNKSLLINIGKTEIRDLPEYQTSQTTEIPFSSAPLAPIESLQTATNSYTKQMSAPSGVEEYIQSPETDYAADTETPDVLEEEVIRLLEERLVVNLNKRKVGEVVVRKEIETRIVEVPVQYEKLIVEQVSPEKKQLAEIDLGHEEIPQIQKTEVVSLVNPHTVSGVFTSPKTASLLLDAIAKQKHHGCKQVRIEIVLEDTEHQETYQEWFARCAGT